ncbi:MAG: MarR family transcriptional regulator [Candidatus Diapherotrites archaeon]|nr:MarR family transcriptional regulator [Candidatus Diapherotrites archaeon]
MKLVSIKAMGVLSRGGLLGVSALAVKMGESPSSTSRAVKELLQKKLVERDERMLQVARNPVAQQWLALSVRFSPGHLFLGSREAILMGLSEPKKISPLSEETGLSEVQLRRLLKKLMGTGAVYALGEKIVLNEDVRKFVVEMKKTAELAGIESYATVLFSNGVRLKRVPLHAPASGTLTAFSRFSEYGIEYAAINDYYIEPARELFREDVFVHALAVSQTRKDLAMCLVFYEKNKGELEFHKLMELARKFRVFPLLLDCVAFLDGKPVAEKERFLPWKEFVSLAEVYGVTSKSKPKFSATDLEKLLAEIGAVGVPLEVFLIGGCNLALQGIKEATKDIDLVVKTGQDFELLVSVLKRIGFFPLANVEPVYRRMNPSTIQVCPGKPRVDIFTRKVCNALVLSERMADRSLERRYGTLSVKFLKPEDIILFKSITDRDGDLEDIAAIIKRQKPDWQYFLQELDRQHEKSERLFCIDALGSLEAVEEKEKIVLEIKARLVDLCLEKSILFLARQPVSVKEILQKIRFPETAVRNKITQLVKKNRLQKTGKNPFKVALRS